MKAQSLSSLRAAVCAGAFAAWFPACLPDGTSPELPLMEAGAGGGAGSAAGSSGLAGSTAGGTAGRAPAAGMTGMAGRTGGAGNSMVPSGMSGTGAMGMQGMAGRMSGAGNGGRGGAGGMAGMMSMAGRMAGGTGGAGGMGGTGGMGGAAGGGRGGTGGMAGMMSMGGAGGAAGSGMSTAATFTQVYGLMMAGCGCHVSNSAGGLALTNKMTAYMNLVGATSGACTSQKRVVANDPNNSVLVHALERTMLGSNCSPPPMPAGGMAKWSQADIDKVKSWIMAGAMNN